jgi:hypothetical protein
MDTTKDIHLINELFLPAQGATGLQERIAEPVIDHSLSAEEVLTQYLSRTEFDIAAPAFIP